MIDLQLLRILKYREDFFRIRGRVPDNAIDTQTRHILSVFDEYFERMPDAAVVDIPTFLPIFRAKSTHIKDDDFKVYEQILKKIIPDVDREKKDGVMHAMLELRLGTETMRLLERFEAGDVDNVHAELNDIMLKFQMDADVRAVDWIRTDIMELLEEEADTNGLQWRLECLRTSMRGLRGGDFGIVAGRPDKGKTTLIASELTHLAKQLPNDRPALWLNNEGFGKRLIPRLYQAALGMPMSEMRQLGDLRGAYRSAVGGRLDRIRVVDIHGLDTYAVENIIRQNRPGIVVYDMIDHIRGFGAEARTDLQLEEMYKWGRELSVKYDLVGICTSQISNEGDGLQFPTLGMLKDSKTGKQGACDFQLMIGASNDPNLEGLRYISLPKNKLRREGQPGDPRTAVAFKPQIARFEDVPIETGELPDG